MHLLGLLDLLRAMVQLPNARGWLCFLHELLCSCGHQLRNMAGEHRQNSVAAQVRAVHQIACFSGSLDFVAWFILHMPCSVHAPHCVTQKKEKQYVLSESEACRLVSCCWTELLAGHQCWRYEAGQRKSGRLQCAAGEVQGCGGAEGC